MSSFLKATGSFIHDATNGNVFGPRTLMDSIRVT